MLVGTVEKLGKTMRKEHLVHLRCPETLESLSLNNEVFVDDRIQSGDLTNESKTKTYKIVNFILVL